MVKQRTARSCKQRLGTALPPGGQAGTARRVDRRSLLATTAFAAFVGAGLFSFSAPLQAQVPTGGVVTSGAATITQNSPAQLTVNQTTNRGVIDWQSFSIGAGASVTFVQPGASSVTLNRVIGPDPSVIAGQLNANGQIVLINPSGVTFANGAQVNVHSLIAATANVGNVQGFMQGGRIAFDQASANPNASVANHGTITVKEGGLVGLVGPSAANHGVINAKLGKVTIGGAESFYVDLAGDGLLGLQIGPATKVATSATNTGTINAPGGSVAISAATARGVVNSIANVQGMVKASTVSIEGGVVVFGGDVDVSSAAAKGGTVTATGTKVHVQSTARINANGATGGGTVLIGGGKQGAGPIANAQTTTVDKGARITASATGKGDGGTVVIWADNTTVFAGTIEARGGPQGGSGGFVETSGKQTLSVLSGASVDAGAPAGQGGVWLIDPANVTINATLAGTISTSLNAGNDVTVTTSAAGSDPGDITVASGITWTTNKTLTLAADRNIALNAAIIGGDGTLALKAGLTTATGAITQTAEFDVNTLTLSTTGGNATLSMVNSVANLGLTNLGSGALNLRNNIFTFTVADSVTATGGITLRNSIWIVLNAAVNAGAGTVSLLGFGSEANSIRQSAAGVITAGTLNLTGGGAVLNTATNQITNLGTVSLGSMSLKDAGGLTVSGTVTAPGGITLETSGALTSGSATMDGSAGTVSLITTGGSGSFINMGGAIAAGTLELTTTNANATVSNGFTNLVNLGPVSLGSGALNIGETIGFTVTGAVSAGGGITLQTGGLIAINNTLNAGSSAVTLTTADTGNQITQSAAITAGTLTVTTGNANVTLNNGGNLINALGTISIGSGAFALTTSAASGFSVSGGSITANGGISVSNVGGSLATASAITASAGAVSLSAATALTLGGTVTGVGVSLQSASAMTLNQSINAGAGTASLTVTGSGNQINQSAGTLTAGTLSVSTNSGHATLGRANAITNIGPSALGLAALSVTDASGGLTVTGAVSAGAGIVLNTVGGLTIQKALNSGGGATTLNATADITQTSTGIITADIVRATTAGGGSVDLSGATNIVTQLGTSTNNSSFKLNTNVATLHVTETLTATNEVSLVNSGGAIRLIAPVGAATVSLSAAGNIFQNASGSVTAATLALSTSGGGSVMLNTTTHAVTNLGAVSLGSGALDLLDAGGLTVTGAVAASGGVTLNTSGVLAINNTLNAGTGAVSLTTTGAINGITQSVDGVITTASLTLTTAAASAILSTATNLVGATGTVNLGAGQFALKTNVASFAVGNTMTATAGVELSNVGGGIAINAAVNGNGIVSLNADGAITQAASSVITASGLLVTTTNDSVDLTGSVNAIGNLGTVSVGTGSFKLSDAGGLFVLGAVNAKGGITISTSGGLDIREALNADTGTVALTATTASGAIVQNSAGIITAGTLTLSAQAGAALASATNVVTGLGTTTISSGTLQLLTDVPTFTVTGTVDVPLGISLQNTGAIAINASLLAASGNLQLVTTGGSTATVTQDGAGTLSAQLLSVTTANANVLLSSATNTLPGLDTIALGTGALALKTAAAGSFTVTNTSITANGGIAVENTTGGIATVGTLTAGSGAISLVATSAGKGITLGGTVSGVGVSLKSNATLSIDQSINAGTGIAALETTGSGSTITATAAITANTLTVATQNGEVILNQDNALTNLGAVSTGTGDFSLFDVGGLTVTGAVTSNRITLNTSGTLDIRNRLTTTNTATLTAGTGIVQTVDGVIDAGVLRLTTTNASATLDTATNIVTQIDAQLGSGALALKSNTGSLTVVAPGITAHGGVTLINTGTITQYADGTITTSGALSLTTTNASATLTDATNAVGSLGTVSLGKGTLSLLDDGGLTVSGAVGATGGVSLNTSGALTIDRAINAGSATVSLTTTGSGNAIIQGASGAITSGKLIVQTTNANVDLSTATNAVSTLNSVAIGSGAFNLNNAGALTVDATVTASGGVTIRNAGAITLGAAIDAGSKLAALQATTGDIVQTAGAITAGTLLAVADAGTVNLAAATNAVTDAVAGTAATSFLFTNSLGITVQAGGVSGNALVAGQTGITANTSNSAHGFVVDLAASGGDILIAGKVSSDKGMIVYRRTAANTAGGITLDGTDANTLGGARLLLIDLSGATPVALYGATPGTALGGAFTTPTPAVGVAGYALGGMTGGRVTLGADFSGATSTIYLGGLDASFSGGSGTASFGLLGVYGTGNTAKLQGRAGGIAPGDTTSSPAIRDFTGVTLLDGGGAPFHVRSDAGNARMTFNGCEISAHCATVGPAVGGDYLPSQYVINRFYSFASGRQDDELNLENQVAGESEDDREQRERRAVLAFPPR